MVPAVAALPDEVRRVGVGQGGSSVRLQDTNNQPLATAAHHKAPVNDLVCASGSACPSVGQRDRKEAPLSYRYSAAANDALARNGAPAARNTRAASCTQAWEHVSEPSEHAPKHAPRLGSMLRHAPRLGSM